MFSLDMLRQIASLVRKRQRPRHIVICGNSRGGTTLFYNMVRAAIPTAVIPPHEIGAVKLRHDLSPLIITKRPLDVFNIDTIRKKVGCLKRLHFIFVARDPRSLVSSRHESVRGDYFQGYDYSYFISHNGLSLTKPGVIPCFEAMEKALADSRIQSTIVRYEDLVRDPDQVQRMLADRLEIEWKADFSSFHKTEIPTDLTRALNGIRPADLSGIDAWRKRPDRARRVFDQFSLEPKLFSILERWGYETDREWFAPLASQFAASPGQQGAIVAFYTEGTLYEQEAKRMRTSAERLGLSVALTPVKSTGSWVRNASMKPSFLLEERTRRTGPLLYVDVDSVFHSDPWQHLGGFDGDMAAHYTARGELVSSTLLIKDTPAAHELLRTWKKECDNDPDIWDQKVLQSIITQDEASPNPKYWISRLPETLCWIFDSDKKYPYSGPIIEQLQASREKNRRKSIFRRQSRRLTRRMERIAEIERDLAI